MGKKNQDAPRRRKGSLLLGRELRLRRGHRSLSEMSRLSEAPPLSGRVEPVSASYLHKLEHGLRLPSIETLRTLSFLYGLTVEHMFRLIESEKLTVLQPEGQTYEDLKEEAKAAMSLGDYRGAFVAAFAAQEKAESARQRVVAAGTKAAALWKLGLPSEAANEFQQLLAEPSITPEQESSFYFYLAEIQRSLWNLRLAEGFGRLGLEIAEKRPDTPSYAALRALLGNVLCDRAEEDADPASRGRLCREAVRHHEKAEEGFERCGLPDRAAATRSNIGVAHRVAGERLLAFQRLREGLAACRSTRYRRGTAFTLKELGRAYREAGEWPAARRHLLDAEAEAAGAGYVDIQFQALVHLIEGAREAGEPHEPALRRALAIHPFLEDRFPERARFEEMLGGAAAAGGMS